MDFLITWMFIGLISALIASRKGHSGCGWFLLGILFGPFGLVFALMVPRNKEMMRRGAFRKKAGRAAEKSPDGASSGEQVKRKVQYIFLETNTGAYLIYLAIAVILIVYFLTD